MQTVIKQFMLKNNGAVAAPTAGLHFDELLLSSLKEQGIDHTFLTLHVGAGTFQPVKVENIENHKMHSEYYEISQEAVDKNSKNKSGWAVELLRLEPPQ